MEHLKFTTVSEDLQLPLEDEQAGHSQTPQQQELSESDESMNSEYKLAYALTTLAFEAFEIMKWKSWEHLYCESLAVFNSFRDEVFEAMAYYAWNLYDKEDLENITFIDDVYGECESIWKSVRSDKGKSELDLSLVDVNKYKKVREQDLCNLLQWSCQNPSRGDEERRRKGNSELDLSLVDVNKYKKARVQDLWNLLWWSCENRPRRDEEKELKGFEDYVQLHLNTLTYRDERDFEKYVRKAINIMRATDNLDPKGKKILRMEMAENKCHCVSDALFMQSWKYINLQKLEDVTPVVRDIEELVVAVYDLLYFVAIRRKMRLDDCQRIVTYPLSNKTYGSWDDEVVKVIKLADLKRRSEERRFIGTDHLLFYLHQMLLSETPYKLEQSELNLLCLENSKDLSCDTEEKHSDTIYHLYRKAYDIATKLGDQIIRLEHLYAAITSGDDDNESSWKLSVECARNAKANRKDTSKVEDEPHTNPLTLITGMDISNRVIYADDVFPAVKRMKDEDNIPLRNAIDNSLNKVDEHIEMTEGEILSSLKEKCYAHGSLLEKVRECAAEHKENTCGSVMVVGEGGEREVKVDNAAATLQERNVELSKQLLRSLDGYRAMKRELRDALEENTAMRATMEDMGVKVSAGLERIRSFKKQTGINNEEIVDIEEEISKLEHMFECFDMKVLKKGERGQPNDDQVSV